MTVNKGCANSEIKYIIFHDIDYYPSIWGEYKTLKKAQKDFKEYMEDTDDYEEWILAKVIKRKKGGE